MHIKVEITRERLADLFTTAIESGDPVTTAARGGWCSGIFHRSKRAKPPEGNWYAEPSYYKPGLRLAVHEVDDETTGHETLHRVGWPEIKTGLEVMAKQFPQQFGNIVRGDADAADADLFLQCVCFGEEKYG